MKKESKVVLSVILVLFIFLSGFGLGAMKNINLNLSGNVQVENGDGAPVVVPTQAETQAPTVAPTVAPTQAPDATTAAPGATTVAPDATTAAPAPDASGLPSTPADVVTRYNEMVNKLKAETDVTIRKVETVEINLVDSSIPAANSAINNIIKNLVKDTDYTCEVKGGVITPDGGETTGYIFPNGRPAAVTADAIATATATADGDGYTLTLKFKEESATFDGTTTTEPTGHKGAMDPLNLGTIDVSPAKITSAQMTYPGADVTCKVNGAGDVTELHIILPLKGDGTGSILFFNPSMTIEGSMDTTFTMTY